MHDQSARRRQTAVVVDHHVDLSAIGRGAPEQRGRRVVAEQRLGARHEQSGRCAGPQVELAFAVDEHVAADPHEATLSNQRFEPVSTQVAA